MAFFKKLKKNIGVNEATEEPKVVLASAKQKESAVATKKKKIKVEKESPANNTNEETKKPVSKRESRDWLLAEGQLSVDVFETDKEFCVRAPIAGLEPEDLDVSVDNGMLTIKGERREEEKEEGKNYFYQECYWGSFARQIALPDNVDPTGVKASLKKGVLTIKIPKKATARKKKVAISTDD